MAIETWPVSLQQLLNEDSFNVEIGETVIRSEMDVGPEKVRRRSTRPIDTYTCSIDIYQTDVNTFKQFFNTTLNGGVNSFYFNDPLTGTTEVFKFSKSPTFSPLGTAGWYRISMSWKKQIS